MYYLIYSILLLAPICKCKGQDVVLTTTSDCYNVNDNMMLEAEYKGSTTIYGVMWTVTGSSSSMIIIVPTCSQLSIPSGFPYSRMSHDCSFAPKYRLTIHTLDSADFNKTWGVDFSLLTGSTASGRQQQTVTQCETVNNSNTGFPRWAIGLIVLVIGVAVVITIYVVYRYQLWLKDLATEFDEEKHSEEISNGEPPDEPNTRLTRLEANEAKENIRHESDNNLATEFDEEKHSEEISNGDPFDEERVPFTNEANKDIGLEIGSNDVKTNSKNNSLKTKPQFLNNVTGLLKRQMKKKKKRAFHTI